MRNTEGAKAAMRAWAGMLVDPAQERADDPMHREMDDQLALNTMFEGQGGSVSLSAGGHGGQQGVCSGVCARGGVVGWEGGCRGSGGARQRQSPCAHG